MGDFANQVQAFNANGIHFFNGAINYTPENPNYDAGDVTVFSNGQQGSFWYSAGNLETGHKLYVSPTTGDTSRINLIGPL